MMRKIMIFMCAILMAVIPGCGKEEKIVGKCTVSIECISVLDKLSEMPEEKLEFVPADGIMVPETEVNIAEGDSALDVIRKTGAVVRSSGGYVRGIDGIDEKDCGAMSGWIYEVNDESLMESLADYKPSDGDKIELSYYAE